MWDGIEIKEREQDSGEILRALALRDILTAGYGVSRDVRIASHLNIVRLDAISYELVERVGTSGIYQVQDYSLCDDAVQKERELIAAGDVHFADGYRYRQTPRRITGLSIDVPDNAIAWAAISAGHIATTEAFRIAYLVKV